MYTTSPSLRRARSAGPTGVPSSTSSIRTSSSRITVTGAVSPVRLGGWPATGTTRLRSACPFSLHRASPSPVRLGGWPATGTTRLRSACPFSLHRASPSPVRLGEWPATATPRLRSACPFSLHRASPSPVRLGGWPATGTTRLRSACPFSLHRASPSPVRLGGWPATGTTRLRSACPFSLRPASAPLPPSRAVSFHALTAVVVGKPHGVGPKLDPPVGVDPRRRPPRRETEAVHPNGQPAGVRVGDLDVRGHDQRRAGEPHRADADVVAERRELLLEGRDRRVGVPAADDPQAGRFLAQTHARVLRAAEAEPDDRRLAREAALAELHQRVDEEPLDAGDPVRREEHAVVGAEEPALVDRGDVDPVRPRLERVRDLGRVDADVVVVIPPCDRVDPIGPEGDRGGRVRRGSAECPLEGDEPSLDHGLVARPHVVARQARVGAHRSSLGGCDVPVPLHLGEDEARDPVPLALTRLSNAVAVIGRNVDRRARHELARCILDELRRDGPRHAGPLTLAYYIAVVSARRRPAVGNEPPGAVRGGEAAQAEDHERPAPGCG